MISNSGIVLPLISELLEKRGDLPLPPPENIDLSDFETCPSCGNRGVALVLIDDMEVGRCDRCGCEFPPHPRSKAKETLRRLQRQRQHRYQRFLDRI